MEFEEQWIENIFTWGFNVIFYVRCRYHSTLNRIIIVQTTDICIVLGALFSPNCFDYFMIIFKEIRGDNTTDFHCLGWRSLLLTLTIYKNIKMYEGLS